MNEPTPYSSTDTAETEAVSVLLSLLNPTFIKADIRVRDKFPNTDGYIELVNEKQVPIGKLDVQVKKIQTSTNKASCPSSLVAYSRITLPILFIGVDIENNKAYWKHINTAIPEFKDSQETFTIKFNEIHDSIDSKSKYIKSWTDIVMDYQARLSDYPKLKDLLNNRSPENTLDAETTKYFQEFSDTVNRLFEYDFIVIKEMLFKDVWKFGVAAHKNKNRTSYGIYKIPYGDQAPSICTLTKEAWDKFQKQSKTLRLGWAKNDYLEDAEAEGEKFVFDKVDKIVTNCKLPIHGSLLSIETLFFFVDNYVKNHKSPKKTYTLDDITLKVESYLERIAKRHSNNKNPCNVRFEKFSSSELISVSGHDLPLSFSYSEISSYEISEAIRYLSSKELDIVNRPYPKPDEGKGSIRTGNGIWCGYTQESENKKIHKILSSSLEDYKEFVNGNKLKVPESPYLNIEIPIIYIYHSADGTFYEEPSLDIYFIHEPSNLPKLSVYVNNEDDFIKLDPASGDIIVDGNRYTKFSLKGMSASFLFYDRPTQKLIYKMLYDDLGKHYKNLDNLSGNW